MQPLMTNDKAQTLRGLSPLMMLRGTAENPDLSEIALVTAILGGTLPTDKPG
jgi:hypothetical protein